MSDPILSVIVTVIDGGDVLRRCLDALLEQRDGPRLDIVVPCDASLAEVLELQDEYPTVRFLDMGTIDTARPLESAAGQHELYDRRRAAGLKAARGDLLSILEDRGAPRADWASALVRLHEMPHAVIGGAIDCAPVGLLNWAFYLCDFNRYGSPFEGGQVTWVSDINVSYKRHVIEATRDVWEDRFHEPIVHWAIMERGDTLFLSPEAVVEHRRPPTTMGVLLPERFHWGRLFGYIRATKLGGPKRVVLSLLGPLVPFVLLVRHGRLQLRKGSFFRYLRAAPYVAVLSVAWTAGEVWGTMTGRP